MLCFCSPLFSCLVLRSVLVILVLFVMRSIEKLSLMFFFLGESLKKRAGSVTKHYFLTINIIILQNFIEFLLFDIFGEDLLEEFAPLNYCQRITTSSILM